MAPWFLLPWILFFFDTLRPREKDGSEGVAAVCSRHDCYSHAGNCTGLLANTGLFLSTGSRYLFLLQRHFSSLDSWSVLLFQFSSAWRQSSVIEVSDLHFSSPLSSMFDTWASISSDGSPCRTIPIQFWVAQTHVSLICTDFPRHHRMESLTKIVKLHPILYRIPEHYLDEE